MVGRRPRRTELALDASVHGAGLVFVAVGVPVLLWLAAHRPQGDGFAAVAVYAAALAAMIVSSALYNLAWTRPSLPRALVEGLRRLDHGVIFLKIAGTYTPFAVLSMAADTGQRLLVAVWTVAGIGATVKAVAPRRLEVVSVPLYLALGWAGLFAGESALSALSQPALRLVAAGGALYTLGVAFHLWERLPFQNAIWHLHVLAASICMYAAVTLETLR